MEKRLDEKKIAKRIRENLDLLFIHIGGERHRDGPP